MRSKTEEFIFKYEASSFFEIRSKDQGKKQTKFLFHRPNDIEF